MISGKRSYLATGSSERLRDLKFFIALSMCKHLPMLQLFPPISHLIRRRQPADYLSLLTPSTLCHDDFVK